MTMRKIKLFIGGEWVEGASGKSEQVINPANEEVNAELCHAGPVDLDRALASAARGLEEWSAKSAWERGTIMRRGADLIRSRARDLAHQLTVEQGKPIAEAMGEIDRAADFLEWGAEEGRRIAARTIPNRDGSQFMTVERLPIGVVAALTPWNFPVVLAAKKLGAALGAGCSVVLKPSEETPGAVCQMIEAMVEAGLPGDVVNVVFGVPDDISRHLIAHPTITKVTFTGSVPVGKLLAARAGEVMKPVTMELGGHSPVIVCGDVNIDDTVAHAVNHKFHNSGQVCIAPTRYIVQRDIYEPFLEKFAARASEITVGDGLDPQTQMGPLANDRRVAAIQRMVSGAVDAGARLVTGGSRIGNQGYFFAPTVLGDVPLDSEIMTTEPFGPVALMVPYEAQADALEIANGVDYGLAGYVYTDDVTARQTIASGIKTGVVGVANGVSHFPEIPLGGWGDSGYGVEGGIEALDPYLKNKLVVSPRAKA